MAVRTVPDVVTARQRGRALAAQLGFSPTDQTVIATVISEVARNIVAYAGRGEIHLARAQDGSRLGMLIVASDRGPGIPDVDRAMQDGYSTGKRPGLGLPGSKRLMDEFEIVSRAGTGTTVTMRKWLP